MKTLISMPEIKIPKPQFYYKTNHNTYHIIPRVLQRKLVNLYMRECDYKCSICGKLAEEIHHIDRNRENNKRSNLIVLCKRCHTDTKHKAKPREIPKNAVYV